MKKLCENFRHHYKIPILIKYPYVISLLLKLLHNHAILKEIYSSYITISQTEKGINLAFTDLKLQEKVRV